MVLAMTRLILASIVLAACTHHNPGTPDAPGKTPDALPDAPALGPNVVMLDTGGVTPDLIVYRDYNGPWLTPAAGSTGIYTLHVIDAYQVLAVCVDPMAGPDVEVVAQTFSGDGASAGLFCGFRASQQPMNEAVSGQMMQPGQIVLGDTAMGTTSPWMFNLQVPMGMHDLIAISTANKVELMHGITVDAPMTLPTVNLATAPPLVSVNNTVIGTLPGETLRAHSVLWTANEILSFGEAAGTTTLYVPTNLLATTDSQRVRVTATTATSARMASVRPPGPTTFALLPLPSGLTFGSANGDLEVTFGTLPTVDAIYIDAYGTATGTEYYTMSASFIAKTGATQIAFDTDIPDFKPQWRVDLNRPHYSDFGAYALDAQGVFLQSSISHNAAVVPARVQRRLDQPPAGGALRLTNSKKTMGQR